MASLINAFARTSMPKRLLRYAVSRLDIFEADALDMDNLDISLGQKNVFEFKDVGMKLRKLKKNLNLPSTFVIEKAKVLLLRVTLPMDIYASPIEIEIEGIDIRLKVLSKEETDEKRRRREKSSEASEFPNAADLAQDFLENQPEAETKVLEEALAAVETQDLNDSMAMSETDSEDEYGTGQALSLPGFLASFLQGVVDRVEVRIRQVTFHLDVQVPVEAGATSPELVTFQVTIDDVDVEGVTTREQNVEDTQVIAPVREGKRRITLANIRAFLISEANVFSTLARSPSVPSSQASQSPISSSRGPSFRQSTSLSRGLVNESPPAPQVLHKRGYAMQDSEEALNIPYDFDVENSDGDEQEFGPPASSLSTPRASMYLESPLSTGPLPPGWPFGNSGETPWRTDRRGLIPEPKPVDSVNLGHGEYPAGVDVFYHSSPAASDSSEPTPEEDLAESQIFSHEQAESMYMSAFSQVDSQRLRGSMPGAWNSAEPSPDSSPSAKEGKERRAAPTSDDGEDDVLNKADILQSDRAGSGHSVTTPPVQSGTTAKEGTETMKITEPGTQDESATPRGPTRLVKEVLSLQSVSIYIPSIHGPPAVYEHEHHTPQVPGAFSVYSPSVKSVEHSVILNPPRAPAMDKSIEVSLAPLEVRFDTSIGFLLSMVLTELLHALKGLQGSNAAEGDKTAEKREGNSPEIKFTAQKISVSFLEKLIGVADTAERVFDTKTRTFGQDVLLQAILENLTVGTSTSASDSSRTTSIDIEKFRFGYHDDNILSFDRRIQLQASVRDVFPSSGAEISVKLVQWADTTKCEVNTLPLLIKLDLQRLDETFSWFGGLSSFLNMGSSMTSNASQMTKSAPKPAQKPRGVRFEAPVRPDDASASSENKMDLRIGGIRLNLVGKDCSMTLDTTALKLVSREGIIGIALTRVRLSGPLLRNSRSEAPIIAEVVGTRLEYLMTPKEQDLERLLELITPSKNKFDENDDVIMVDTLLRQRRKGPLLRVNCDDISVRVRNIAQLQVLPALGEEVARLATVARYLPEDDRPGLLTLGLIRKAELSVDVGKRFGVIQATLRDFETAQITIPPLVAVSVGSIGVTRNHSEELVGSSAAPTNAVSPIPVLMLRLIGDDLEPAINVKLRGLNIEYRVPTIMAILDLGEDTTPQDFEAILAQSVVNLGEQAHTAISDWRPQEGPSPVKPAVGRKPTVVNLNFSECILGLNPHRLASKLDIVLIDAKLEIEVPEGDKVRAEAKLNKISLLLIDDVANLSSGEVAFVPGHSHRPSFGAPPPRKDLETHLCAKGFVKICQISSAKAEVHVLKDNSENEVVVNIRDDLLVLETCADSTQTLIALANALKPPTPPSKEIKYRTEVMPIDDLLASISIDAFGRAEGNYNFDDDFAIDDEYGDDEFDYDDYGVYEAGSVARDDVSEKLFDATSEMSYETDKPKSPVSETVEMMKPKANFFGRKKKPEEQGERRWNSARQMFETKRPDKKNPFKVSVRDVHIIWNLFDGYDWEQTRDVIAKTVKDVETKATERKTHSRRRSGFEQDVQEEEVVIGDFLFNSIYIGIPANHDPRELTQAINHNIYGETSAETESVAATTVTAMSNRTAGGHRHRSKRLKLSRSKRQKISFELSGICVDITVFPPWHHEMQSSVDVRVREFTVFDLVPTSTWKKFATIDRDAVETSVGSDMARITIHTVQPVRGIAATELVLNIKMQPLRLHVDQDALDFITRFFNFKDDSAPTHSSPSDVPFIQRCEVNNIPVHLDFKPKRVDYAGLRAGHTTEFMNFITLDSSHLILRHTIVYGVRGFDRLGQTLDQIWTADVKSTQLPGVLAGLAPVRSLVDIGSGIKDLIEIPIREYKRDGRVLRAFSKGAVAFAKSTGTELIKLGAKVATGTQNLLQGAEGLLVPSPEGGYQQQHGGLGGSGDDDDGAEPQRVVSLYADQPAGVVQGLRHAYRGLRRDLNMARDAIIAVPAEVRESGSAAGAAGAVMRRAPTIIFRPAIGASKAIGQTLLGATNSLDPANLRRVEDKYKSGPGRM